MRSNLASWRSKPSERHFCLFEIGRRDQRSSIKYPVFFLNQVPGRVKHFPVFPSMIRACYGRCESLTTFQCQVVENEAWPQTDGSLELQNAGRLKTKKASLCCSLLSDRREGIWWPNTATAEKPSWNGPRLRTQRSRGWRGRATPTASPKGPRATLAWKASGAGLKYQVDQRHTRGPQAAPQAARTLVHWAKQEKRETTPQGGQQKKNKNKNAGRLKTKKASLCCSLLSDRREGIW